MSDAEPTNDDEPTNLITRLNDAADLLDFPARRVGPAPGGDEHTAPRWGIHFRTNRTVHLGSATVHAGEPGRFDAVLGEYDGDDRFVPVAERTLDVEEGRNEVDLDLEVEPGEYLLTREGDLPLLRDEWDGWREQSHDGFELIGGSKPGDFERNRNWYYFFHLHVAAHVNAHPTNDS